MPVFGEAATPERSVYPVMPDFASPHFNFHHTIDSALESLFRLGVPSERVYIRMDGAGLSPGRVVGQEPSTGTILSRDVVVRLSVAGLGMFHHLPVAMWERGENGEIGTQQIVELLDDPYQKAAHWIREGARLFDIHPDNKKDCERWIELFGLNPHDWPEHLWFSLAILLPKLHQLAGTEVGIRTILGSLLGLPLLSIKTIPARIKMEPSQTSSLGDSRSELGLDLVLGDTIEAFSDWHLHLGPVTLETYDRMETTEYSRLMDRVLDLCVPCFHKVHTSYEVLDRTQAPQLGAAGQNSRLGINSWLGAGTAEPASAAI